MDWRLLLFFSLTGGILASKPLLKPPNSSIDKFENESIVISCYTSADTEETVTWTAPNKSIIPNVGRIHYEKMGKTSILLFDHIQYNDRGQYTCTSETKETAFVKLNVIKTSQFINTPKEHRVKEYQSTLIRCEVDVDPKPQMSWKKDGNFVDVSGTKYVMESKGLKILNATRNDTGVYTCRAIQGSSDSSYIQSIDISLKVQHKPEWKTQTTDPVVMYGYIGGETNLTCEAVAQPEADYTWNKQGKDVKHWKYNYTEIMEGDRSVLKLYIHSDVVFGIYNCQARNKFGTISKAIELKEGEKPGPPTGVRVVKTEVHTAELKIASDVVDLVGYRVQFVVTLPGQEVTWEQPEYQDLPKTEDNHYTIIDLLENTSYTVRVAARGPAGLSDYTESTYTLRTLKVGDMTTSRTSVCTVYWLVVLLAPLVLLTSVH
ncbi:hemicentin-1-like [Homalodisca vitripennis]|uniref:hemicentin-1-like n=1 Tax=Homalodisca vitripennis TaxID=197043 RepID=UPI001EEBE90A|nr:hemicentin-1-like [Homalodisca vitripennis]